MKHSELTPYIQLSNDRISILEAAQRTIKFYKKLSLTEPRFEEITLFSYEKSLFDKIEISRPNSAELLAEGILNRNISEIRKNETSTEIDIHYSNTNILSYTLISTYDKDDTIFSLMYCFTESKWLKSSIGCLVAHENYFSKLENCICFLKSAIEIFDVKYATIRPTNDFEFTKSLNKYKHNSKLGTFTYYSNDMGYNIPNELQYGEIEKLNDGVLYKLNAFASLEESKKAIKSFMRTFEKMDPTILKDDNLSVAEDKSSKQSDSARGFNLLLNTIEKIFPKKSNK